MPKKPLWNFWRFLVLDTFHSSGDHPKWFFKGLFLIQHPFLVRTGQKNDFEIFFAKRRKLFEPLYRVKGGSKCVFSGLFSLLYSFLARKCPKNHFEIFDIFWSQTPCTPLRSSKMVFQGVIFDSASITGENRPKKWLWNFFGWKGGRCLSHIIGSRVVQNAVFGGFTQFPIHFWPENAQKTTLKFLTFSGPRHPALLSLVPWRDRQGQGRCPLPPIAFLYSTQCGTLVSGQNQIIARALFEKNEFKIF